MCAQCAGKETLRIYSLQESDLKPPLYPTALGSVKFFEEGLLLLFRIPVLITPLQRTSSGIDLLARLYWNLRGTSSLYNSLPRHFSIPRHLSTQAIFPLLPLYSSTCHQGERPPLLSSQELLYPLTPCHLSTPRRASTAQGRRRLLAPLQSRDRLRSN